MHREFNAETISADAVMLSSDNESQDSIKFGIDPNGKLGYIAPGADTVVPFRGFGDVEAAYNDGIADARLEYLGTAVANGNTSNTVSIYNTTFTFQENYARVIAVQAQSDSDNNNDNFMKVYSVNKGFTTGATPAASYWTDTVNEWNYYKMTNIAYDGSGGNYGYGNSSKYSSVPNDYQKDFFRKFGSVYVYFSIAYKDNVKHGDVAVTYASAGTVTHFFGIPATGIEPYDGATEAETDIYQRGYLAGFEHGGPHTGYDVSGGTYVNAAAGTKTVTVPYPGYYIFTIADSAASSTNYEAVTATGSSGLTMTSMGAWHSTSTETSASPTSASFAYYLVKSSASDETITVNCHAVTGSRVCRYRLIRIGTSGDGTSAYEQGYADGVASRRGGVVLQAYINTWAGSYVFPYSEYDFIDSEYFDTDQSESCCTFTVKKDFTAHITFNGRGSYNTSGAAAYCKMRLFYNGSRLVDETQVANNGSNGNHHIDLALSVGDRFQFAVSSTGGTTSSACVLITDTTT